ncbi:MAG: protein PhnA [Planctomycetota bacterium]|jgi:protein PhnA
MSQIFDALQNRANGRCELCSSEQGLGTHAVGPMQGDELGRSLLACEICLGQLSGGELDEGHWFCLRDTIWSEVPAVQVQSWRMLHRLQGVAWAGELLEQAYLDEGLLDWAQAGLQARADGPAVQTVDSNGTALAEGDAVSLIKALEVKGGNFTAKRGTLVKGIRLTNNPEHVEGRVNGMTIVLKTCFLKRMS